MLRDTRSPREASSWHSTRRRCGNCIASIGSCPIFESGWIAVRSKSRPARRTVAAAEERLAKIQAETKAARIAVDQKQLAAQVGRGKNHRPEGQAQRLQHQSRISGPARSNPGRRNGQQRAGRRDSRSHGEGRSVQANDRRGRAADRRKPRKNWPKCSRPCSRRKNRLRPMSTGWKMNCGWPKPHSPPELRDAYNRAVKSKGEDAMAQVEGESCGGCHQQLTPNIMSQLVGSTVVFCRTCGRLLYLPEIARRGGSNDNAERRPQNEEIRNTTASVRIPHANFFVFRSSFCV